MPQASAKLLLPPLAHDPSVVPGPIDFLQPDPSGRLLMLAEYTAPELGQAPEAGRQGAGPTWQSEIYALGCTLYHLMAGRPPFTGDDVSAKLMQHATAEPVAPLETFGVPPWVAQVVSQMMDKNVTRRYQNPQQVVAALGVVLQPPAGGAAADVAAMPALAPEMPLSQALPPMDLSGTAGPAELPAASAARRISAGGTGSRQFRLLRCHCRAAGAVPAHAKTQRPAVCRRYFVAVHDRRFDFSGVDRDEQGR